MIVSSNCRGLVCDRYANLRRGLVCDRYAPHRHGLVCDCYANLHRGLVCDRYAPHRRGLVRDRYAPSTIFYAFVRRSMNSSPSNNKFVSHLDLQFSHSFCTFRRGIG
jgi:hypothetical protein